VAQDSIQVAAAAATMVVVNTRRPPYWSVQMPSASLISEPTRIGVPTSRPNCVSLRPSSRLICTPMIEKIVHTAKHAVKAAVLIPSAMRWSPGPVAEFSFIVACPRFGACGPRCAGTMRPAWRLALIWNKRNR
jgi:hypothetical protein